VPVTPHLPLSFLFSLPITLLATAE
jgi:hypothetical protein